MRMNIALIIAGGTGHRMKQDIPKQFLNVFDKPVIIYTLEGFQRHPEIDAIEVVCLDGWDAVLWAYAKQFQIDKLRWVIPGGETAQESIRNGIFALRDVCAPDDILVIHDGIRPMVEDYVLSDVLLKCRQYGNAVTSLPYNEKIFVTLMADLGERLYFAAGSEKNIKLTTKDDFELFKCYMKIERDTWLK